MSHILSAVDLDDVHYLLLDCTGEERFELNSYFCFNVFNPIHMDKLKRIVGTLNQEALNKLPSGNLKRNLINLMGLNEMEDIIALDYSYDASLPTSDYKYPVVSFTPQDCDEDDEYQMLHLTITNVSAYDSFMNTPMPSYIHHGVTKLGEVNNLKVFLGKTTNGQLYLYSLDKFGIQSSDLSYTIS